MDDRASISISDALQYTPSIQTNYFGEDNKQDWFIIRGLNRRTAGCIKMVPVYILLASIVGK